MCGGGSEGWGLPGFMKASLAYDIPGKGRICVALHESTARVFPRSLFMEGTKKDSYFWLLECHYSLFLVLCASED